MTNRPQPGSAACPGHPHRTPPAGRGATRANTPTAVEPAPPSRSTTLATDPAPLQARLDELEARFADLKGQLRHLQKLATLGTTAAMVAHEINNLLTPITAYARQALEDDDPQLMRHALRKTLDCTRAMGRMVDRVAGFARQGPGNVKAVNVRDVAEDALGCLARDFTKDQIDVTLRIDEGVSIHADENPLLQVLINLITNARHAMAGRRGRLTIRAAPDGDDRVLLEVSDTGCGIAPEHLDRVFDPFFSTRTDPGRADRRGLGLGLPICRDIVEELGGTITLESQVDVGTTFRITLPRAT